MFNPVQRSDGVYRDTSISPQPSRPPLERMVRNALKAFKEHWEDPTPLEGYWNSDRLSSVDEKASKGLTLTVKQERFILGCVFSGLSTSRVHQLFLEHLGEWFGEYCSNLAAIQSAFQKVALSVEAAIKEKGETLRAEVMISYIDIATSSLSSARIRIDDVKRVSLRDYPKEYPYAPDFSLALLGNGALEPFRSPLFYEVGICQTQGGRRYQEDRASLFHGGDYILVALFDGHGGADVSDFLVRNVGDYFHARDRRPESIHYALNRAIWGLQQVIFGNDLVEGQGSTAVISYIDLRQGLIYSATVGDSEVNCYRPLQHFTEEQVTEEMVSIPLSPLRTWHADKDRRRWVTLALGDPFVRNHEWTLPKFQNQQGYESFREEVPDGENSNHTRLCGTNVARALGDRHLYFAGMGVIPKPKITVGRVYPGDTAVFASDGLKNQLLEPRVAKIIGNGKDVQTTAEWLTAEAERCENSDNVTVIVIQFKGQR